MGEEVKKDERCNRIVEMLRHEVETMHIHSS